MAVLCLSVDEEVCPCHVFGEMGIFKVRTVIPFVFVSGAGKVMTPVWFPMFPRHMKILYGYIWDIYLV